MLNTTRPALRMLASGYDALTSSELRQLARVTRNQSGEKLTHELLQDRLFSCPRKPIVKGLRASLSVISPQRSKVPEHRSTNSDFLVKFIRKALFPARHYGEKLHDLSKINSL
jgi:hypothetical protein